MPTMQQPYDDDDDDDDGDDDMVVMMIFRVKWMTMAKKMIICDTP